METAAVATALKVMISRTVWSGGEELFLGSILEKKKYKLQVSLGYG